VVLPELQRRLTDKTKSDDAEVKALVDAVKIVPSDTSANDSSKTRALQSLPWAAGKEPFTSSEQARTILSN